MFRYFKKVLPLAAALLLVGCSESKNKTSDSDISAINPDSTTASENFDTSDDLSIPLLSIETVNQAENVLDFVTKPVTRHVAESIASWTPNYQMPPEPYYEACKITLTDTDNTVLLSGIDAQVKARGNWTTTYDKKALKIKFAQKQNMLGLNDGAQMKNWLLLAEYKDASMLRNKTALSIASEILEKDGLYTSDAEFVEVRINNEYWGVYLLAEMQQINPDRVNITDALQGYTGTDIGYFMEFDGYFVNEPEFQQFRVDYADNAPLIPFDGNNGSGKTMQCLGDDKNDIGISIKNDIYAQEQKDFISGFVNDVYKIMYYAAYEDKAYVFNPEFTEISEDTSITSEEAVKRVVDVNSLADMYIISELTCDADIYWSSFYMSADFGAEGTKKLVFEAPWDFDSAMGNKDRCADGTGFYAANIVPDVNGGPEGNGEYVTINPWLAVIIYEDWFQDIIKEKWTEAYDSGVFERAYSLIESDKERCALAFERNYKKWNNIINNDSFAMELSEKEASCKTQAEAADYLSEWLKSRVEFLNSNWHK
jgi:hypothetical protein